MSTYCPMKLNCNWFILEMLKYDTIFFNEGVPSLIFFFFNTLFIQSWTIRVPVINFRGLIVFESYCHNSVILYALHLATVRYVSVIRWVAITCEHNTLRTVPLSSLLWCTNVTNQKRRVVSKEKWCSSTFSGFSVVYRGSEDKCRESYLEDISQY